MWRCRTCSFNVRATAFLISGPVAVPRHLLRFDHLIWCQCLRNFVAVLCGILISLHCGKVPPHMSTKGVLDHSSAIGVHNTKVELRDSRALSSCQTKPPYCLTVILRHTLSFGIHRAKVCLCIRVSLFCGTAIPPRGLAKILSHAFT